MTNVEFTVEEYFQIEKEEEIRYEFYNGELFPVEATTVRHNEIVQNLLFAFRAFFRPKGCKITTESVKVEVQEGIYYPYPDLVLSCDPTDSDNLMLKKPVVIIEVLSPSTGGYDKSFKWRRYRKMPSLRYYLMVSQEEFSVEVFTRAGDSDIWSFQEYNEIDAIIPFSNLNFELK
jgi:Uma2 family endonuclease